MQDKLLTIVVPTYNISEYIEKCIHSFLAVNEKYYKDFEVIVVNDGSTDNSVRVVENLIIESDLDLRIISKENGGHGSTINVGITEAKGKYFKVIDGDDWIDISSFETLLEKLKTIDVDMVISNYTEQHVYNNSKKTIDFVERIVPDGIVVGLPDRRTPMHALTYKTSILKNNDIRLSEKTFYVDTEYTLLPIKFVKNYVYYDLDIYQYFLGRPDQSMHINIMKQKSDHHYRVTKRILELYKEIHVDKIQENIVREALIYLINKQCQLAIMNDKLEEMYELFDYANKCGFRWKYDKEKKVTSLISLNYRMKRIFDCFVSSLAKKKQKEWSEIDAY